jgi:plastocyanin domain-containing protein
MLKLSTLFGTLLGFGLLLSAPSATIAQMPHDTIQPDAPEQPGQFHRVAQPLWLKATVTTGGLGLMGLELWWFLFSKPKSGKATPQDGM